MKAGVGIAQGERFVFMDADLSADIADLPRLIGALDNADVAVGSRSIAGSRIEYQQPMRQFQSKFFNSVACVLTKVVASDTQCGFKAFRADAGKLLFHLCEGKGFAFDVEVLALAQLLDMRIVEVPIHWVDVSGTSVRMVRDPLLMVRDIMRTRAALPPDRAAHGPDRRRRGRSPASTSTRSSTSSSTPSARRSSARHARSTSS